MRWILGSLLLVNLLLLVGWAAYALRRSEPVDVLPQTSSTDAVVPAALPEAQRAFRFGLPPDDPWAAPRLEAIELPALPGATAVWGATGIDGSGAVWFGVSAARQPGATAHLLRYDPDSGRLDTRGDVLTQLQRNGRLRPGESQQKIHSRIVQAADGLLYFASMDESGEVPDGTRLPTWGSHLWRIDPAGDGWEHLQAVPEGLIAVAGGGRYVYCLGYFGHVLYQYDTRTGQMRRTAAGSVGGHVSRNLLSDRYEHVYAPSVRERSVTGEPGGAGQYLVELVEWDENLRELGRTRIFHYGLTRDDSSHGIVGLVDMADGSLLFLTDQGYLYRIMPRAGSAAEVRGLGWFHPEGTAYAPSLFTFDGVRYVVGAGRRPRRPWEWIVFDLATETSRATRLDIGSAVSNAGSDDDLLLYGSNVRDGQGSFYLGGWLASRPLLLRIRPGAPAAEGTTRIADAPQPGTQVAESDPAQQSGSPTAVPSRWEARIVQATARDWRAADAEDKQAMCQVIVGWLHPDATAAMREAWARRYRQRLDEFADQPHVDDAKIADWLPMIRALLGDQPAADPARNLND
jgi:hypothetical protein